MPPTTRRTRSSRWWPGPSRWLAARVDAPLSVATSRATVARAAFDAGAVTANDRTGCAGRDYLAAVAEYGATVVTGGAGRADGGRAQAVDAVLAFLVERAGQARSAGIPVDRIVLDGGLGQMTSAERALALLRASDRLADLGHPLLLSVDAETFVGMVPGPAGGRERGATSLAATALGAVLGCRVVRTRDVAAHHQVCSVLAAVTGATR